MSNLEHVLSHMVRKFKRRVDLSESDEQALLNLPFRLRTIEAARYLVREGMETSESSLVVNGFAFRQKSTADGARQIVSIHIPGDFVDLEGSLLRVADHSIQALTRCEVAMVPIAAINSIIETHPRIARAMWVDTLIDGSIFREWVLNVGRRDARERLAHLICEFGSRLELAGLCGKDGFELPMSQEQLGDATGLTTVHVNRTLKALEADGLIERNKRSICIPDWARLRKVGDFSELYLHLDQLAA